MTRAPAHPIHRAVPILRILSARRILSACRSLSPWLGILWILSPVALGSEVSADPRQPLSAAERAAVQLALDYLDRGPDAWWDALATASPFRRLGRERALAEIEVRAGPAAEARWTLRTPPADAPPGSAVFSVELPSGVDDALFLGLVEEGGEWKLDTVTTLAEPGDPEVLAAFTPFVDPAEPTGGSRPRWILVTPVLALLLLIAGLRLGYRGRLMPAYTLLGASVLTLAVGVGAVLWPGAGPGEPSRGPASEEARTDSGHGVPALRALLPLRLRLSRSLEGATPGAAGPRADLTEGSLAARVADLWWAQRKLAANDLVAAEAILEPLPSPGALPLTDLLRARLAQLRGEAARTAIRYEDLVRTGRGHDGLLLERALALARLGYQERAEETFRDLGEMGSRDSEIYYTLAELAVWEQRLEDAQQHLEIAWRAQPRERAELLRDSLLAILVEEAEVQELLDLDSPVAPSAPCSSPREHRLMVPSGFQARLLGEHLQLAGGDARLEVPGGCGLAPAGTRREDPVSWRRTRERAALERVQALLRVAREPGALGRSGLHRPVEEAVQALARSHRWGEVAELTAALPERLGRLPNEVIWLRAQALEKLGYRGRAQQLLLRLIRENQTQRRPDPTTFYLLAELYLESGDFETAFKLTARADALLPYGDEGYRLRRILIEQRLVDDTGVATSPHFVLRFPEAWNKASALNVIQVLEAEYLRLQKWVPVDVKDRIEVHLIPLDSYQNAFSPDLDALGLFDGKVRLPFGDLWVPHPFLVSVLSHEVTHALIAARTEDRAPRWFHEGLAQHVQMLQERLNPLRDYRRKGRALAFPLLEPALQSLNSNLVTIAYDESNWVVHYLEHRYGKEALHRLLDAFREGQDTEEALGRVLGVTPVELDRELWRWAESAAPDLWQPEDSVQYEFGTYELRPHEL